MTIKNKASKLLLVTLLNIIYYSILSCNSSDDHNLKKSNYHSTHKATFVGAESCAECHEKEYKAWLGSHHEQAMKIANDSNVLGNFNNAKLEHFGITYQFFKENRKFKVLAENQNGDLDTFVVKYTFGFDPLQQYIVTIDEREQMLPTAWGADPKKDEKPHWFHLYTDEKIAHNDMLHWTAPLQNWNYMCAECHSTNLKKNYNLENNSYTTSWNEINVSCEACHGPASKHNLWAQDSLTHKFKNKGLVYQLKEENVSWNWDLSKGTAYRSKARTDFTQIEMCARCHSRRSQIKEEYVWGEPLAETHHVELLNEPIYHPDGQILDEDYVYASFLQSKMYQHGVTCTNCHDPHTNKVKSNNNNLCLQCHSALKYDSEKHHFHKKNDTGSVCVDCHMPTINYMVKDPRRDHSMRNPRPDLSISLGVPNACNQCHTDKNNDWSLLKMKEWYGTDWIQPHYGEILHAARKGNPSILDSLVQLITNEEQTNIVRATAISELHNFNLSAQFIQQIIEQFSKHPNELIRRETASLLQLLPINERLSVGFAFLNDSVKSVRLEATIHIAASNNLPQTSQQNNNYEKALNEYITTLNWNEDRAESHLSLAKLFIAQNDFESAEQEFQTANRLEPNSISVYINWADFYRLQQQEKQARTLLNKALELNENYAPTNLAMGLSYIREKQTDKALNFLKKAHDNATNAYPKYIYAVAIFSSGKQKEAIQTLEYIHKTYPFDLNVINALISFYQSVDQKDKVKEYSKKKETLIRLLN